MLCESCPINSVAEYQAEIARLRQQVERLVLERHRPAKASEGADGADIDPRPSDATTGQPEAFSVAPHS